MIAFLAESYTYGRETLQHDYQGRIVFDKTDSMGAQRGTIAGVDGDQRFILVTREDQLCGLQLSDYRVIGSVDRRIIAMAEARLR